VYYDALEWVRDELHPGPPYKSGGAFDSWKYFTDAFVPKANVNAYKGYYAYKGRHIPAVSLFGFLSWNSLTNFRASDHGNVFGYGATGWNKFRPTRSSSDVGVFLGELHELPRMLETSAKDFARLWRFAGGRRSGFGPKSVAEHWLNSQYGWLPFIRDLQSFYKSCFVLDTRLRQLRRDNGHWVKRGGVITSSSETTRVLDYNNTPGLWPVPVTPLFNAPWGYQHLDRTNSQHVWFKGRFKYWIPHTYGTWRWNVAAYSQLFGLRPSPSLIWELTPWSWLSDWVTNIGDVMASMSSIMFDNLCAKYAYVMGTTSQRVDYEGRNNYKLPTGPMTETWYAEYIRKSRVAASPFGFGLTNSDFTARQWSILAALGLSRLR
jgi:hypothetical protein